MNNTFLISETLTVSYRDLLKRVSEAESYIPVPKEPNLFLFFTNLLTALVHDLPITLVDSDLSEEEILTLQIDNVNVPEMIRPLAIDTVKELAEKVIQSRSSVTIFTSGTTGQPKKVTHNFSNLSRAVKRNDRHRDDIWGFAYNPTHMAGILVFLQAITNGNPIVNLFNRPRNEVYSLIERAGITHLSATPTFYRLLLPMEKEYSTVKRITFGGEKSDIRLHNNIINIFPNAKVTNVYASTEAGSLFASNGSDFRIPQAIKDKIKVEESELLVHRSLLGNSESLILEGDYYRTGDLIDWVSKEEGIFRFISRKNELINVGGYKVNPQEVEDVIRNVEGIKDVRVFGKPNSVLGNVLCADILLTREKIPSEIEIKNEISNKLQDYKIPRRIKFVEDLNLTRTGKLKR